MDEVIAQRLCHMLANCEEEKRTTALRSIAKLFKQTDGVANELTLLKICKALYYMLWMTDKPLKVRRVAVSIVELQSGFTDRKNKFRFFSCLFKSLSMEWYSLDKNRLDKMLLFVRIVIAAFLELLNAGKWDKEELEEFGNIVLEEQGIFNSRSLGLAFQFLQTFLEEMKGNMEEQKSKNEWSQLDEISSLRLMRPFLHLVIDLENKQLVDTLFLYVLNRVGSIPGVPCKAIAKAVKLLSKTELVKGFKRKLLVKASKEIGIDGPLSPEEENEVHGVISRIETALQPTPKKAPKNPKTQKPKNERMDGETPEMDNGKDKAPKLMDISDEIEDDMDDEFEEYDDDGYLTLRDIIGCRRSSESLIRRLGSIATSATLKKYLIDTGRRDHKIMKRLNSPYYSRQFFLLALYKLKRRKPLNKFRYVGEPDKIMDIGKKAVAPPSKKGSIDIAKALHNIKHAKPGKSIVRKRNRKPTESKHVVFNLKNNQIATIPKKKRGSFTMPVWY